MKKKESMMQKSKTTLKPEGRLKKNWRSEIEGEDKKERI